MNRHQTTDLRPLESTDPEQVGGYPLLGRIGAGGMGTVFLGRDPDSGERVAVKTIHPHLAGNAAFRERFRDEAVLAGRVASFCTARVVAHGDEEDRPYIVSEYVGGMSLQNRIDQSGPLPAAELHGVAVSVASALAAIHAAGLVHHDLKPANVMLTLSGCRVIDFGIARTQGSPGTMTTTGSVLGTPGWMPPEVIAGGAASPAADMFGWGCLVAYAGTGRLPFGAGAASAVALRVMGEEPDLSGLPESLLPAVRAALSKDPAERPTASALLLSLVNQTDPGAVEPDLPASPSGTEGPETQALGLLRRAGAGTTLRARLAAGAGVAAATVLASGLLLGLTGDEGGTAGTAGAAVLPPRQEPAPAAPAKPVAEPVGRHAARPAAVRGDAPAPGSRPPADHGKRKGEQKKKEEHKGGHQDHKKPKKDKKEKKQGKRG
ncbi:serine/threonine-protein kinase [Actinomadura macrotermitis]|uniref:Serine/threonine-protein kinase PknD n=1 Tax=Actinomadura macrotermitis TaxID=2585200 RepID=A0A7K0BYS7_9ACTN|nr:serine/threonine-protein kinase [Actinomadura macrotermitis]MQY06335.1 Serine/threonine-protein kinase PknD [Actinomadura macrotermitis]